MSVWRPLVFCYDAHSLTNSQEGLLLLTYHTKDTVVSNLDAWHMHHLIISIHLSILLTAYPVYNHKGTEAYPSCHGVRGGEHLGQVANLLLG